MKPKIGLVIAKKDEQLSALGVALVSLEFKGLKFDWPVYVANWG